MEQKIQTQMRKGILDFLILGILKTHETYGWEIIQILKDGEMIVVEGTVYPLLSRLVKDGFVQYFWVESQGGHPRKYFQLTKTGEESYNIMQKNWKEIKHSVEKILSL